MSALSSGAELPFKEITSCSGLSSSSVSSLVVDQPEFHLVAKNENRYDHFLYLPFKRSLNLSFMSMFSKVEMEARFNRIFALECMHHLQTVKIELKYKRKKLANSN